MRLLIDGHNLIGQMPDIHLNDPYDEEKLALRLKVYCIRFHHHCTVIFDNGLPGGRSRMSSGYVTVIFAPYKVTADSLIIRRIRDIHDLSGFAVVTSDRLIIGEAERRGVTVIRSQEFAAALSLPGRSTLLDRDSGEDPNPVITAAEVSYWLEVFGVDLDYTAAPKQPKKASDPSAPEVTEAPANEFEAMFGKKADLTKHGRKPFKKGVPGKKKSNKPYRRS